MPLINHTPFPADAFVHTDPDGRPWQVVRVKGTWTLPGDASPCRPHPEPDPLVDSDTFSGPPGLSAPRHESDAVPPKRYCDVLLLGQVHAPGQRPVTRLPVGLRVGDWSKGFVAVGPRHWQVRWTGTRASAPRGFVRQPLSYEVAFGGCDYEGGRLVSAYGPNPVGQGYHATRSPRLLDASPLPLTEAPDRPVTSPREDYAPLSLGPVGRNWPPRLGWAGRYDEAWRRHRCPRLPQDFDARYYQSAAPDQWIPHPRGGETVLLRHLAPPALAPRGVLRLALPDLTLALRRRDPDQALEARVDTLLIEPERGRLITLWGAAYPLGRLWNQEPHLVIGTPPPKPRRGHTAVIPLRRRGADA